MSDEEWIKKVKTHKNDELFRVLELCGCDPYYKDLWETTVNELKRRMKKRKVIVKHVKETV